MANRHALLPLLQECFSQQPAATWLTALEAAGVPCSPIRTMADVFSSPEGSAMVEDVPDAARGLLRLVANPIRFDGVAPSTRTPPPLLGEHDGSGWADE